MEDQAHLEVDPVYGVADVLEHALVGHEEVAVLEARLAAAGEEEEQRHTRAVGRATALARGFQMVAFRFWFSALLLYGIAFPCWRGPQPNRKAFAP